MIITGVELYMIDILNTLENQSANGQVRINIKQFITSFQKELSRRLDKMTSENDLVSSKLEFLFKKEISASIVKEIGVASEIPLSGLDICSEDCALIGLYAFPPIPADAGCEGDAAAICIGCICAYMIIGCMVTSVTGTYNYLEKQKNECVFWASSALTCCGIATAEYLTITKFLLPLMDPSILASGGAIVIGSGEPA